MSQDSRSGEPEDDWDVLRSFLPQGWQRAPHKAGNPGSRGIGHCIHGTGAQVCADHDSGNVPRALANRNRFPGAQIRHGPGPPEKDGRCSRQSLDPRQTARRFPHRGAQLCGREFSPGETPSYKMSKRWRSLWRETALMPHLVSTAVDPDGPRPPVP